MTEKVIVLHSGGMDSTVCLLLALEQNRTVMSLGIDYDQTSKIELEYAKNLCDRFGVQRRVLSVHWDKLLREIPLDRNIEEIRSGISPAFLPGRNIIFLVLACAEASKFRASEVWIGVNSLDYSGYPDCRQDFLDAFQHMIDIAIPDGPKIIAPLSSMSKPDIALVAHRLGLCPNDTWSCYRPLSQKNGYKPCGRCDACVLHNYAWDTALARKFKVDKD